MARISTYPIISTPTVDDLLIGTDVNDLNITKNFTIGEIGQLIGQDYVPYVGATGNVNLGSFNITASSFIVPGGLASQFVKADGSLDGTAYTPQARTLTINGTTYNLSANRSWDLNTINSLTTIGTGGAATYIGKVLNIPVYQAQGAYITQLSGEATAVGPGNATVTLDNTAVISKILTGLNVTGGTVLATDTILQAFGKVQNQINGLAGGVEYQGTWNAATNNPFLQSSVGVQGHYYVVNVAGNTNLNGITDWQVGDWAIYNGSAWEKVDNTDAVVSVNGYTGAVVLTSSDVGAVPTTRTITINGVGYNLSADRAWTVGDVRTDQSYTNPSWIASLAWSKITGTPTTLAGYGITDGALNTRTLTINGVTYDLTANRTWNVGTVTSVGTSGPLTGGTITGSGTIGITQAGASSDGYLSSADWNAFNSKQEVISVTAPITFAAGVIGITQSGASSNGYLSSTDWTTFNSKVSGSGTANTLPMWGTASSLINSPLSYAADAFNFQYNSSTGGTVNFTNIGLIPYTYSIQMNNFGSPRSTIHSYTDGVVIQSIGGIQVSRMFADGNLILGTSSVNTGHKLTISGDLYVNTIVNAIADTDRFIVSDGGVIKYRTGAEILADIGAQGAITLTTTGTSGPATLISNTLNIPNYGSALTGYVPYTGATQDLNLGTFGLIGDFVRFNPSSSNIPSAEGVMSWDNTDGTVRLSVKGNTYSVPIGQSVISRVRNNTGTNLLRTNYQVVKVAGAQGQRLAVTLAQANNDANSASTLGLVCENISNNQEGFIVNIGQIVNVNTTGNLQGETWLDGDVLYLSPTIAGAITKVKPLAPQHTVIIGYVEYAHANNGKIYVKIDNGYELEELHDVSAEPFINNGLLYRDTTLNLWKSATIDTILGYTPAPQGNYITSLTGEATASGPGAASVTLSNSAVTGKVLTGLNITGNAIVSTDSILTAFGKLQNQVNQLVGGLQYEGTWNASTNTPTITSSVGTDGTFYIVSVAGTTNINGINDWQVGDWIVFHDTTWQKVDNSDSVSSVFGRVGNVVANQADYSAFYPLIADIKNGVLTVQGTGVLSGSGTFSANQATNNTITLTHAAVSRTDTTSAQTPSFGGSFTAIDSVTSSAEGHITAINTKTVTVPSTVATATQTGLLSSTDWSIFNGKQNAITLTTTGTTGPATLIGATLNIPNYTPDLSGYVTLGTDQTITGLKTIIRSGDVLNFKIGTDTLYGLKVAYNQNELVPSGEATWSFVNTFNRNGVGYETTPISFFRGVLVTGERLLSASINTNLLDYYSNNPSGRYPVYAYNTGVQQFSTGIIVGKTTGVVNAVTGAIADLPAGVVANFNGRVIGGNAVNSNEFVTLSQVSGYVPTSRTITINGTTQDLSANRTFNVGTVTSVTASSPLASSGGTTPNITISQSSGSTNGFLSSTDWTTFNNKANANGSNASGTWSINITGSAGSAGSASTASLVNGTSGGAIQSWDIRTISPSSMTAARLGFGFTSWANNNTSPWADYLHLRSYSDGSGGADNLVTFLKSGIGMRIWQQSYGSSTPYSSYADVLLSTNFSSYALPLTGGTLTGPLTIGTSINSVIWNDGNGTYIENTGNTSSSRKIRLQAHNGSFSYTQLFIDGAGGFVEATNQMRAPIFYDSNNTSYYLDPASTSVLNGLTIGGRTALNTAYYLYHSNRDFASGTLVQTNIDYSVTNGDPFILEITGNSYGALIPFDIQVQGYIYANTIINSAGISNGTNISGLRAINFNGNLCFWWPRQSYWQGFNVKVYSAYATYPENRVTSITDSGQPTTSKQYDFAIYQSFHTGNISLFSSYDVTFNRAYSNTDMRAPIFYDSNDTAYYIDGHNISSLNILNIGNGSGGNQRIVFKAGNDASAYSALRFEYAGTERNTIHLFGPNWQSGSLLLSGGAINLSGYTGVTFGPWNVPVMWVDNSGNAQANASMRAPIFYDSNDTGYYLDPTSTRSLRTVGDWRSDSGPWTGEFNGKIQYHSNNWYLQAAGSWVFRSSAGTNVFFVNQSGRVSYTNYLVSTNSGGLMGDYDVAGTTTKVIWTIGESWPLANMYGLAYEYGSGYGHHLALKNNGTTYSRIGFAGDAFIGGTTTAGGDFRAPIFYDSNNTGYYLNPNGGSYFAGSLELANGYFLSNGIGGAMYMTTVSGSFGGYLRTSGHMVLDQMNAGYNVYVLDGNSVGVVKNAGSQSWSAFSDRTIKTIHSVMEDNLSKLESISPIYYSFNNFDDDKNRIGLIAQEVQEHFPELVEVEPMTEKLVLDYTGLIPVLLGAIKELKKEIDTLKIN